MSFGQGLQAAEPAGCAPVQEFITTVEYLRKQKHVGMDEAGIRNAADQVSQSCTGGGRRFREAMEVLSLAELPGARALGLALRAAESSDERSALFLTVFKVAFARNGLDLTAEQALELAERLALGAGVGGDVRTQEAEAGEDFKKIALHCLATVREGGWELPRVECARLAVDIAARVLSGKLKSGRAPGVLRDFVQFASREGEGPTLALRQAIQLGEELLSVSDRAPAEYITGWKYAVKESGLGLPPAAAQEWARKLALRDSVASVSGQKR
jgi:hypothetical protein